ncbi:MAG TPA: aldehyde dehydrogenase family protein [Candidatus Saccharimonadales bacterium]|nr:aldehyde dehydrogenase family protein [Candidatus Saccharimonadales bacterium]
MSHFATQLFLDGNLTDANGGQRIRQVDPSNEELFAEVHSADASDVDRAVKGAQRAFEGGWRDLKPGERAERLYAIANSIREISEALAQMESRNIGKPISDARDEIELGARVFEYYAGAVTKFCGQTIPVARGGFDFTLHVPMGVIAAIVPWNFPFPIACWKVAPALAAGNSVVLKPASQSPLTAITLGQVAFQAGLPSGVLQVLPGSGKEVGDTLVMHPLIRKVSFTGSTEVGSRIMQLAAGGLKRVSLELGGKSPNIVFADADVEQAASASPMSVFANTGQDCCARSRVFVEEKVFEKFVSRFVAATKELRVGDPARETTQLGPLVSAGQRAISEEFLAEATKAGRKVATGGGRPLAKGFYLEPTVLLEVEPQDRCWREEIFGPVVCIRPFKEESEMLREVNASPFGLSGSIWTNDLKRAMRMARYVESGVLSINSHSSVHVEAPFGGFKQSGIGRDLGMAAMEGYTELKNIYVAD